MSRETRDLLQGSADTDFYIDKVKRAAVSAMKNRGRKKDKHDNPWRVYEVDPLSFIKEGLQGDNFRLLRGRIDKVFLPGE